MWTFFFFWLNLVDIDNILVIWKNIIIIDNLKKILLIE